MGLLSWLFGRAPRIEDPVEPLPPLRWDRPAAPPPAEDPAETLVVEIPDEDEPLENLFCTIEYEDANGRFTRRQITMISLTRRFGIPAIFAVCHMRRAVRNFRVDRIRSIITADGEVFDGPSFLTETMGLDLAPSPRKPAPAPKTRQPDYDWSRLEHSRKKDGRDFRDIICARLTVLVACGKADGHFHRDEVDRILIWAEREAEHLHKRGRLDIPLTIEEADALAKTVGAMRPQERTLRRHMLSALNVDADELARFRKALEEVIQADGVLRREELDFLQEFDELARMAESDPRRLVEEIYRA